jgi:gliding motility-associated-like protein
MRGLAIFFFLVVGISLRASSTHIVGGDFTITFLEGSQQSEYEMSLILYYDIEKGVDIPDMEVQINVFRKFDKANAGIFILKKESNTIFLDFKNPKCKEKAFGVQAIRYSEIIKLSPFQYNDPGGYYAVWQRCCRNSGINNIANSVFAGMAFYLEFPSTLEYPKNSLPKFNPVLREYFCPGEVSTFSASAFDPDGDSLVYSLEIPIRGKAQSNGNTVLNDPGPYPLEQGYTPIPGFSGIEGISINASTGEITIAPANSGVYLFSALCQEFSEGKKIGEVRREFEILVDQCFPNEAPFVELVPYGWDRPYQFYYDTLFIRDTSDFCHTLLFEDMDGGQELTVEIIPSGFQTINFSATPNLIIPENGGYPISELCLPLCIEGKDSVMIQLEIIVEDNACPLGKSFTQRLIVIPDFPENFSPDIRTNFISRTFGPEETISFEVFAVDQNIADFLTLDIMDAGTLKKKYGVEFVSDGGVGSANGIFTWKPDCRIQNQEDFTFYFSAFDNKCNGIISDSLRVDIFFDLEGSKEFELKPVQNVLTPNGDGKNDFLDLSVIKNYECQYGSYKGCEIYDRWGKRIFSVSSSQLRWDPIGLSSAVYYYLLQFENREITGYFTLLK